MAAASNPVHGNQITVDDVVWCIVDKGYPDWPCKVEGVNDESTINVQSFGDNHEYTEISLNNIENFTEIERTMHYIAKGRKKFKNKTSILQLFNQSVMEATISVQNKDPQFTLPDDTVTAMINKPVESTPIVPTSDASDGSTTKTRYGRKVKALETPTHKPSSNKKPKPKRKKVDREGSVGADPTSQGSDPGGDSPTLLFQQSISRLSAKRDKRKREAADTVSPVSLAKKHCSEDLDEKPPSDTESPQKSLNKSNIAVNLSDELIEHSSTPASQDLMVKESSIMSDSLADVDVPLSPLSVSKESNSDDELLPATYDLRNTELKFADLKVNDLIWAKYYNYPYWPSIVTSIQTKSHKAKKRLSKPRTKIMVYFLGVIDDASKPFAITKEANIVSYSYAKRQEMIDQGRVKLKGKPFEEQFEQAVKEADELKKMRINNKISGSPQQQIEILIEKRQSFIKEFFNEKEEFTNVADDGDDLPSFSAFGFAIQRDLFSDDDDSDDSNDEWVEQPENADDSNDNNSPYNFKNILSYLEKNKSLLVGISTGKVNSELHNTFHNGSRKDRERLKITNKLGPAKLSKTEETDVLTIIQEAVKETFDGMGNFSYAYDVLLPEIMMRMISQQESCSVEEAKEMFF